MEYMQLINFIEKNQPFKILGFKFHFENSGANPLGNEFVSFQTNKVNNRSFNLNIAEIDNTIENNKYLIVLTIQRIGDLVELDEINFFDLKGWLQEKKIPFDSDIFTLFSQQGSIEEQMRYNFIRYKHYLEGDALSKIIKGENWERRSIDWRWIGK